jgi:hypothetical protein
MNHFDHVSGPSIPVNENPGASTAAPQMTRSAAIAPTPMTRAQLRAVDRLWKAASWLAIVAVAAVVGQYTFCERPAQSAPYEDVGPDPAGRQPLLPPPVTATNPERGRFGGVQMQVRHKHADRRAGEGTGHNVGREVVSRAHPLVADQAGEQRSHA